jgi:hypothetical protein
MAVREEPEVLAALRAFPKSQELLRGVPLRRLPDRVDVGWYDTATHPRQGAFAVVGFDAGMDELIGEVLRISVPNTPREAFVYVVAARAVPVKIAVARRAFFPTLGLLARESLRCVVEVVE